MAFQFGVSSWSWIFFGCESSDRFLVRNSGSLKWQWRFWLLSERLDYWPGKYCKPMWNYDISNFLCGLSSCGGRFPWKGIEWYFWLLLCISTMELSGPSLSVMCDIKWKFFGSLWCIVLLQFTTKLCNFVKSFVYFCEESGVWQAPHVHSLSTLRRRQNYSHAPTSLQDNNVMFISLFLCIFLHSLLTTSNLSCHKSLSFHLHNCCLSNAYLLSITRQWPQLHWTHEKEM